MKIRKTTALLMVFSMLLLLVACGGGSGTKTDDAVSDGDTPLTKIIFSLDWTQNTNHTGLYVAKAKGYFTESGLDVEIAYLGETYTQFVASGHAQFGMEAQDTLADAFAADEPLGITAVAAVLQHNTSGIISRKGDGIVSPKGLSGKRYSTWNYATEQAILKYLVEQDGGNWDEVQLIPNDITDEPGALEANQTDAIWIYYGWSGVNAQLQGFDFDYFYLKDLDPTFDYYTPVIIGNNAFMEENPEITKAFLSAVKKGYEFAAENPEEAAQILIDSDDTGTLADQAELVKQSQAYLSKEYIADADSWGKIDGARWDAFYKWLNDNGVVEKELPAGTGYTNEYLG